MQSEVKVAQERRRRRVKPEYLPMLVENNGPQALSPEIIHRKTKVVPLSSLKINGMQLSSADNALSTRREQGSRNLNDSRQVPYNSEAVAADLNVSFESITGPDSNHRRQLGSFDNTSLIRNSVESIDHMRSNNQVSREREQAPRGKVILPTIQKPVAPVN